MDDDGNFNDLEMMLIERLSITPAVVVLIVDALDKHIQEKINEALMEHLRRGIHQ